MSCFVIIQESLGKLKMSSLYFRRFGFLRGNAAAHVFVLLSDLCILGKCPVLVDASL